MELPHETLVVQVHPAVFQRTRDRGEEMVHVERLRHERERRQLVRLNRRCNGRRRRHHDNLDVRGALLDMTDDREAGLRAEPEVHERGGHPGGLHRGARVVRIRGGHRRVTVHARVRRDEAQQGLVVFDDEQFCFRRHGRVRSREQRTRRKRPPRGTRAQAARSRSVREQRREPPRTARGRNVSALKRRRFQRCIRRTAPCRLESGVSSSAAKASSGSRAARARPRRSRRGGESAL